MTRFKLAVTITVVLVCVPAFLTANAQQGPQRDASAMTTLQASIAAMGGPGWASVADSETAGTIKAPPGSHVQSASFVYKTLGGEVRYETNGASWAHVFASGHGKPAASQGGQVKALPYHVVLGQAPLFLPALVLATRLADSNYSLIDKGTTQLQGKKALVVQSSYAVNQPVSTITLETWYFDSSTGLPLRVESRLPDTTNMGSWTDTATDFSAFGKSGDLIVPFTTTDSEDGSVVAVVSIGTVQFNVGLDPSQFDLLGGGQ